MCRHVAFVGGEESIGRLLVEPPHGLYRQSWAPRHQRYGTVNADGIGVGWYADGDPVPARYRRARPVWADPSFTDLARVVRTRALLAAVRSATDGCAPGEAAAAPADLGRRELRPAAAGSFPAGAPRYGARQLMGDVWEWTSSDFGPYPGFRAWPYREYSEVFFGGDYKVLRGGSFAVDGVACRGTFRNWDHPVRRQIFAGFPTARDAEPGEEG
jgi:formylglycine-generating enzyme required for sulfatase activity